MQEIFTKAVTHLLTQNCKSQDIEQCLYRGKSGTQCAAGPFIPDEVYDTKMEGNGFCELWERWSGIHTLYTCEEASLISKLQHIHDSFDVDDWRETLTTLASERGLRMPVL